MRLDRKALTVGVFGIASALVAPAGLGQWGPWGGPAWGPPAPPVVTYEDVDVFYGPLGPSWADIRRIERRSAWQGRASRVRSARAPPRSGGWSGICSCGAWAFRTEHPGCVTRGGRTPPSPFSAARPGRRGGSPCGASDHEPHPRPCPLRLSGILFDVYQWDQELFDGSTTTFEAVRRIPSVQILATTPERELILLREEQPYVGAFVAVPGGPG